ncbi:MAG: hypothetical protein WC847_02860 [Candidatus Paceibacterota bacterium]|jgi:hypothetical protein
MINDQLVGYIRQQLSLKVSREEITTNLKSTGWNDADVAEAFSAIGLVSVPASMSTPPVVSLGASGFVPPQSEFSNKVENIAEQTHNNLPSSPVSKSKKIFYIILVFIFFGLAGGGVYAYFAGFFVSLPSLTSQAIDSARIATSATYDITASFDFSEVKDTLSGVSSFGSLFSGVSDNKANFTTKGNYDNSDGKNIKSSTVVSFDLGKLSLAAEIRFVNDILYGTLTKVPVIPFMPIDLSKLENKWVSFPFKSEDGKDISNPISSLSPVDPTIVDELTPDQKENIYKMFRNAHFIKAIKKLPPETVGGELSYHFIFDFDREGITAYLETLKSYVNTIGKDNSKLSSFDPTSFNKSLDNLHDFKGEIWIGHSDKLLHKLMLNFSMKVDPAKDEYVKVALVGIFSNWNKPVNIVAPAESISFEEFFSQMMSSSPVRAQENGASIKANLSMMRAQAEIFYDGHNNSYLGFCSSKELKEARKSIESTGGTGFVCKDKATAWAGGAKLPDNLGNWCVDSLGAIKSTANLPSGTVCSK